MLWVVVFCTEIFELSICVCSLSKMDALYKLTQSRNSEIRFRWQTLCLRSNAEFIFAEVVSFLKEQGRMKVFVDLLIC